MKQHPNLCAHCGGKCCTSPLVTNRELRMMMAKIGTPEVMAVGPVFEGNGWFRLPTCPALTPAGCSLVDVVKPIVCRLYPFQFVAMPNGGYRILLDVDQCLYWRTFGEEYQDALVELRESLKEEQGYAAATQS
jgi:Fe-S-cluster containining protein